MQQSMQQSLRYLEVAAFPDFPCVSELQLW